MQIVIDLDPEDNSAGAMRARARRKRAPRQFVFWVNGSQKGRGVSMPTDGLSPFD